MDALGRIGILVYDLLNRVVVRVRLLLSLRLIPQSRNYVSLRDSSLVVRSILSSFQLLVACDNATVSVGVVDTVTVLRLSGLGLKGADRRHQVETWVLLIQDFLVDLSGQLPNFVILQLCVVRKEQLPHKGLFVQV